MSMHTDVLELSENCSLSDLLPIEEILPDLLDAIDRGILQLQI